MVMTKISLIISYDASFVFFIYLLYFYNLENFHLLSLEYILVICTLKFELYLSGLLVRLRIL